MTAASRGCEGLMVLPPYVYKGDWREMKAHVAACFQATKLSCMLYNNPVAYGTDFLPEHIQELANEFENFQSVKESSTDVRRVTAIKALIDDRLDVFVGVDDAIVEACIAAHRMNLPIAFWGTLEKESFVTTASPSPT